MSTTVEAMEPVMRAIRERRSIRRYTDAPVPDDAIDALLEAAIWAPSAVNTQPWAFGIIRDRSLLDRYAARAKAIYLSDQTPEEPGTTTDPTLVRLREMLSQPGYHVFHGAGTLMTIYSAVPGGVPDCFLAAENLMLAGVAMGLGTCPIGLSLPLMNEPDVKAELGVPEEMIAALPIVVGYPAENPDPTPREAARVLYRR